MPKRSRKDATNNNIQNPSRKREGERERGREKNQNFPHQRIQLFSWIK